MTNPMGLEGRNIIVTGAGQGIGEAVSRLVVGLGGKAILVDVQADKVNALAEELGAGNTEVHVGSVAEPEFVQSMVNASVEANGAIHGLVNNAGALLTKRVPPRALPCSRLSRIDLSEKRKCFERG